MQETKSRIRHFLHSESAGGVLLMVTAVLAMIVANTPLRVYYDLFIATPVHIKIGPLEIAKPLLLWVNDGLMAGFFFLVGLELKRELLIGELSEKSKITLPALGAIGGMVVPALIYYVINKNDPTALRGWAIPTATDIAFALGILSIFGSRVPISLKILLTSLAIFDDIGAILIIALFYTDSLSIASLGVAAACMVVLFVMNRSGQEKISMYIFVGSIMWVAVLKSGVHATLAGVALAMFIPMNSKKNPEHSPVMELEHDLHGAIAFYILPLFAFCNSGISMMNATPGFFFHGVPLGIALGLFFGKQLGVFGFIAIGIKTGLSKMPAGMNWGSLYGMAALCGIGFTMSLFIGSLAFTQTLPMVFDERFGIVFGSLISGLAGAAILAKSLPKSKD